MADNHELVRVTAAHPEWSSRERRRRELQERYSIKLPISTFTIRSILGWMSRKPDEDWYYGLVWEARSFFDPLLRNHSDNLYSCVYKHVGARLKVFHGDPGFNWLWSEEGWVQDSSVTVIDRYSGLHEDFYDTDKFTSEVRASWIAEAADLALQETGHKSSPEKVDRFAADIQDCIDRGFISSGISEDPYLAGPGRSPLINGVNCDTITNVVRRLLGFPEFRYCPIGKLGTAPQRDRWEHCPSTCAERGCLGIWHRTASERLLKDPKWQPTTHSLLLPTTVPCYFCSMAVSHEPGLNYIMIGGIKQRAAQPYLNTDDQISLDILAQAFVHKSGFVGFFNRREVEEYIKYLDELQFADK